MINYVDPARVSGLSVRTITGGDSGDRRVHIAYPFMAGAPLLNEKLRRTVTGWLDRFTRGTTGKPSTCGSGGPTGHLGDAPLIRPELNVDWQLSAASDQVIGVRLRVGESTGADWSQVRTTLWYDRVTGQALDSTGLLRDAPALAELAGLAGRKLAGTHAVGNPLAITPEAALFDSLAFNPRGDLVVEFDGHQVTSSPDRVAVAVPAAEIRPLLSATGARAQRAATDPASAPPPTPVKTAKETFGDAAAGGLPAESSQAGTVDCARARCVALTYDDGPGPGTRRLLDVLAAHRARATFFTSGGNASARPELLRRMMREGHLVANHTWSHRDLTSLPDGKVADQLSSAQYAITRVIGRPPGLMRPPYGAADGRIASIAGGMGLAVVRWSVDPEDGPPADPRIVADRAVARAERGSIILLHDVHASAVGATPEILRRLRERGYTFVTVPELYGTGGMRPGGIYDSGDDQGKSGKRITP
ncbi:hypothetical protein GCM10017673_43480 [Streptosporangium violaceochromogenes]|nr:hypothetical protein GCM10017673_43480 [Streptosporangium violaceochromogenes]